MGEELSIHSDSRLLAGRVFAPTGRPPSSAGILFVHGSESSQEGYGPRAEAAAERLGATCLTFDLSGHGGSEGSIAELSLRDHLSDCIAAFDLLLRQAAVDSERIGVCGASYGGFLGALLIGQRPIRSLLLRAPALYGDECLDRAGGTKLSTAETPDSSALRNVAAYERPILVLESERDEVIPHSIVAAYLAAGPTVRHETIPGAGHSLREEPWRVAFVEAIVAWFGETLG